MSSALDIAVEDMPVTYEVSVEVPVLQLESCLVPFVIW